MFRRLTHRFLHWLFRDFRDCEVCGGHYTITGTVTCKCWLDSSKPYPH